MSDATEYAEVTNIPRDTGVNDIDDGELQRLCSRIRHVVQRDLNTSVQRIYVMGSFARGEAREVASDLDLRVLVSGYTPKPDRRDVERHLKNGAGPAVTPSVAGYIDVHITPARPPEDEPSTEVWSA
jgi:predicted nucleotidyltransferase